MFWFKKVSKVKDTLLEWILQNILKLYVSENNSLLWSIPMKWTLWKALLC